MRALIAAVVAGSVAVAALGSVPFPSERERWIHLSAGDFQLFSNGSERQARQIATNLLRMREALGAATRLRVRSGQPTYVYLFSDEKSFAPYREAMFGKNKTFIGGFASVPDANFLMMCGGCGPGADRLAYHELTHSFVHNTLPSAPPWFNEGLAEYYSTFETSGNEIRLGRVAPERLRLLRSEPLIPLRQFFAMDHHEYTESERIGMYYAEAWMVVHYLLQDDRQQLAAFLTLLGAGRQPEEAFRQAFSMSYEDFESRLRQYAGRSIFTYRTYRAEELPVPEVAPAEELSRVSTLTSLGRLLVALRDGADAETFASEALKLEPASAEGHLTLARVRELQGSPDAAAVEYGKAIDGGLKDAALFISLGETLLRDGPSRNVLRARQLFHGALDLDPTSTRALYDLGVTYLLREGDDPAAGIAALEKAEAAGALRIDAARNLFLLYLRAGRKDDARSLMRRAHLESMEPMIDSGRVVARSDNDATADDWKSFQTAVDHANARRFREALKIADQLLAKTADPVFRKQVEEFRAEVARRAAKR